MGHIAHLSFHYFEIIFPCKRTRPFIWTKLNSLHSRLLCAKFSWNKPSGSRGEDFNLTMYFRYFVIISPWKRAWPFIWRNLNSLYSRKCLFDWFWPSGSEKIFEFRRYIFAISLLSPIGKGLGPSFEQTWIPFTQGCFVPSLVEIDPMVLEKKIF